MFWSGAKKLFLLHPVSACRWAVTPANLPHQVQGWTTSVCTAKTSQAVPPCTSCVMQTNNLASVYLYPK